MLRMFMIVISLMASNYLVSQTDIYHPEIGLSTSFGLSMLTINNGMVKKTDGFQFAYGVGVNVSHRIGKNFGISFGFGQSQYRFGYNSDQHFETLNDMMDSPVSLKEEEKNLYLSTVTYNNNYWVIPFAFDIHLPAHRYSNPVSSFRVGFKFFKLQNTKTEATYQNINPSLSILNQDFHTEIQNYLQNMTPTLSTALSAAYHVKWRFKDHWNIQIGFELNQFLEKMNQGLMGSQFGVGITGAINYAF